MKNNKIQDERILAERRRIQSRGYAYIVYTLLVSIIVQQFFMKAPFAQYAVEFFVLIGCGIYNIISNYMNGIDIWNPRDDSKKQILISTLISGIASVILYAVLSGQYELNNLVFYFVFFVIFFFGIRLIMNAINKKKQETIDKQLNNDDNIE